MSTARDHLSAGHAQYARGDFVSALRSYREALALGGESAELRFRLGATCYALRELPEAKSQLTRAVALDPSHAPALAALAEVELIGGELDSALAHVRRAVEIDPKTPDYSAVCAAVLAAKGDAAAAGEILEPLIASAPLTTRIALVYARVAPALKRETRAVELVLDRLAPGVEPVAGNRASLHYAAAHLLDRLKRYDDAFAHAEKANRLRNAAYDPRLTEVAVDDLIRCFSPERLARLPRAAHGSRTPVFIVGMPRSGTSLVEQVLASHPAVYGGGELDWVGRLWAEFVRRRAGGPDPLASVLDGITPEEASAAAAAYLQPLRALSPGAARVTDKMPTNAVHLGLIAMLFPESTVVHCRRDPMDVGLSCYMTDFAAGHAFTCDLRHIGHYARQLDRLTDHWKKVLLLRILDVNYERFVADFPAEARRLVDFVGLPWDDRCLNFHENPRVVATASQAQVRQPVYASSVGRWKHYAGHLQPLHDALEGR